MDLLLSTLTRGGENDYLYSKEPSRGNMSFHIRFIEITIDDLYSIYEGLNHQNLEDVAVTMKEEEFDKMDTYPIHSDEICTICQECIPKGEIINGTKCRHEFHTNCLKNLLLNYSVKCPTCRAELAEDYQKTTLGSSTE